MKFVRTTRGGIVNLDHVAAFEPHDHDTYKAIAANGTVLGIVDEPTTRGLEFASRQVVTNTIPCAIITFWFDNDGAYNTERIPVLAWEIDRDFGAMPITLEDLPKSSNPHGSWLLELPESYGPYRFVIPGGWRFEKFEAAAADAVRQWQVKRMRRAKAAEE